MQINFIHIIALCIIIKLAISYRYYNKEDVNYITNVEDFDNYSDRYKDGKLYHLYQELCPEDKLFVRDLISYEYLKYKNDKPSFKKMCKSAGKQIFGTSFLSYLFLSSSLHKTIGQNTLGYFVSNVI